MLDKEELRKLISTVATSLGKDAVFIEKDYYQTLMLQKISNISEKLVFKGGTSLSKCYKLINRFSEDIDISAKCKLTEGERRRFYHAIIDSAAEIGLSFPDTTKTKSKRLYNRFEFEYESAVTNGLDSLIIETNYDVPVYPIRVMKIPDFIGDYFESYELEVPTELGLVPLKMNVQEPIRTFIDKVFALCDYHIKNEQAGHSRHMYDITVLFSMMKINDEFTELFAKVREERSHSIMSPSAAYEIDLQELFLEVINDEVYKKDYENVTMHLIYEHKPYIEVQKTLQDIYETGFLK